MLRTMSIRQFYEWMAYAELEPFDEMREDYRTASVVAMLANLHRDRKRRPQPFRVTDFLLPFGEPERKRSLPTWQHLKTVARGIVESFTG